MLARVQFFMAAVRGASLDAPVSCVSGLSTCVQLPPSLFDSMGMAVPMTNQELDHEKTQSQSTGRLTGFGT